ncbi:MAG TPA: chorismate synthase [Candidatus Marinimicrobia bacterium]|nr:chorismate synthase [Candidatus Neomarinimicrobiota bacterium]
MIRMLTAGESHGKGLSVIIDGFPAGMTVDVAFINAELNRRQKGYGRGKRMQIESDEVEILSGVRNAKTIGSPISLWIKNRDYGNWSGRMNTGPLETDKPVTAPRPGHADLTGIQKFGLSDVRDVLERASARETAGRVAAGALCKQLLKQFDIRIFSHTIAIGSIMAENTTRSEEETESSALRCRDAKQEAEMMLSIENAGATGNTLGGISEIVAKNICPGLGTYAQWNRRLDARIAEALMSIPSVKGVFIGDEDISLRPGSEAQDEIDYKPSEGFYRKSNHAGGVEGGMSNGEDLVVRIHVKPLPSLGRPLKSVDIISKKSVCAQKERADVCVVPAAGVVGEAMLAFVLTQALTDKFGGDSIDDIKTNYQQYLKRL